MSEKKKAIVLLVPGFPANEEDSTCIPFLQEFVISLVAAHEDIAIHIITFQYPYTKGKYKWKGAWVYSLGGKNKKFPARIVTWLRALSSFLQIKRDYEIVAIQSVWLTETAMMGAWLSRIHNIKHIGYAVGQDVLKKNKYLKYLDYAHIRLVATTESIASTFHASTEKKITDIIPQGVNENILNIPEEPKTIDIIGVGNITPLKNYSAFIDAILALQKDFPGLKSCIIGNGEQMEEIKSKVFKNGLQHTIELTGELPHETTIGMMNKSKIFLHPSTYEGQCTAIMEALAMGCIVVCFNIGIIPVDGKVIA